MNTPVSPPPSRPGFKSLAVILLVVVGGTQAWHWWQGERAARMLQRHATQDDIVLYTTSTCPYCARAREWLRDHDIAWHECNVETDAVCMQAYESQGAPGVPLVRARGQWHLGFDPVWLAQVLEAPAGAAQSSPSRATSPRP